MRATAKLGSSELPGLEVEQDVTLGIAPSTEFLLDRWRVGRSMHPEAYRPKGVGSVAENNGRMWARRWRKRVGARYAAVRVCDEVPPAEARSKARDGPPGG